MAKGHKIIKTARFTCPAHRHIQFDLVMGYGLLVCYLLSRRDILVNSCENGVSRFLNLWIKETALWDLPAKDAK
jgi:hypothetical protein